MNNQKNRIGLFAVVPVIIAVVLVTAFNYSSHAAVAAQQQQSGGAVSSIVQGGNTAVVTAGGALRTDASATTQPVSGSVSVSNFPASQTVSVSNFPATQATTQSGTWTIRSVPQTTCGTTAFDSGGIVLPTTATTVNATDTCVEALYLTNVTATDATVTVTNAAGTINYTSPAFKLAANSSTTIPLYGLKVTGGVRWSAGTASAVHGQIVGIQ